jgi:glycosyltransferase involved in cell wall biosynthesis
MNAIRFSVVINNFNYGNFVREAIISVKAQKYRPCEIIVVDDGSADDSMAILESLKADCPELVVISQENFGQLSAIRAGVHAAFGEWLCFLDADDTWEPTHLEAAAQAISCETDLGVYYSGHKETSGPPIFRSKWSHGSVGPCAGLVAARGTRIGTITSALCLRREFALMAVDLDESFDAEWRTRADDCLVFGASITGAIFHYNPIQTVNYRIHGGNTFADKIQDPYMVYSYDRRKWRLIMKYCEKSGIRRDELFRLILWELGAFTRNREHRYCRSRFLQGLKRTPAPLGLKVKTLWRLIRGKYR